MSKRRRRTRSAQPRVRTFVNALSELMALEKQFGRCQGAIVVDAGGTVRDGVVLTDDWHTIDHALSYVLVGFRQPDDHVLLFSGMGDADIRLLGESELDAYAALDERCTYAGVHLADWLIAGGGFYRSMQLALTPPADDTEPGDVAAMAAVWRLSHN